MSVFSKLSLDFRISDGETIKENTIEISSRLDEN